MPLRDHFRPPLDDETSWEGLHAQWPGPMVARLNRQLPPRYVAAPRVRVGGSLATDLPEQDEYEVRVYDTRRRRRVVAAVELVSPANKDRPENRRAFAAKCATLLGQGVSVAIVDVVTTRQFNLYGDLLDLLGQADPALAPEPPPRYAVATRWRLTGDAGRWERWAHPLSVGLPLPTLPLWLADDLAVPLDLEATYEQTCRELRIA